MSAAIAACIAVIGTLLGAVVSGAISRRTARDERDAAREDRDRQERVTAVTGFATAVSAHRGAMWAREEARLTGAPADRVQELRDRSRTTREAVTEPHVRLRLLISSPAARAAADAAARATYDMRNASTLEELRDMRGAALAAHDEMIRAASTAV